MPGVMQSNFATAAGVPNGAPPPGTANAVTLENLRQRALQGDGQALAQLIGVVSQGSAAAATHKAESDKKPAKGKTGLDTSTGGLATAHGPLAAAFQGNFPPGPPDAPMPNPMPGSTMPPEVYPPPSPAGGPPAATGPAIPGGPPAMNADGPPGFEPSGSDVPLPPQSATPPVMNPDGSPAAPPPGPGMMAPPPFGPMPPGTGSTATAAGPFPGGAMPPAPTPPQGMAPNIRDFGYKQPTAPVVPPEVRHPWQGNGGPPPAGPAAGPPNPAAGPLHEGEPIVGPPGGGATQAPALPGAAANAKAALGGEDWGRTLMEFGLNTMAAASQRGATAAGAIGQGGNAALQSSDRRANIKTAQARQAFDDQMAVAKFNQDDRKILADLALRQSNAEQMALDRRLSREDRAAARSESNALRAQGQAIMAGNQQALQESRQEAHALAVENSVRQYDTALRAPYLNSGLGITPAQEKEITDKVNGFRAKVGGKNDIPPPDAAPVAAPAGTPGKYSEGDTAVDATGRKAIFKGGQWQLVQ